MMEKFLSMIPFYSIFQCFSPSKPMSFHRTLSSVSEPLTAMAKPTPSHT